VTRSVGAGIIVLAACCAMVLAAPSAALSYEFGEDVQARGAEEIVFDHSDSSGLKDACAPDHIPDLSPRVFRRADGRVEMILAHMTNRRMIGPSLGTLTSECGVLMESTHNGSPGAYDDAEWIAAPYTTDGTNVAAIIHNEYHGFAHDNCAAPPGQQFSTCWSSTVTLGASTNQGDTFTHAAPPGHFVAALPYRYSASQTRNTGLFAPSNIIQKQPQPQQDDFYYLFLEATGDDTMDQQYGACVLRTRTLDDPASWRAWDGTGFNLRFVDPYANPSEPPAMHLCQPVSQLDVHGLNTQVTYNSYLDRYVMIDVGLKYRVDRPAAGLTNDDALPGLYYSTSTDLVHWTGHKLLMASEIRASYTIGADPDTGQCLGDDFIAYPALLDPGSSGRNFETTGAQPYLYFVRTNARQNGCIPGLDRDLVRIPIRFNKEPAAAFAMSPAPTVVGKPVGFDASASTDADGPIARYQWDLDGNGSFETDTGTNPSATRTYSVGDIGTLHVGLRVTDGDGTSTDTERLLVVGARVNFQPDAAPVPARYTKDTGLPYDSARGYGWVTQQSVAQAPHGVHAPLDLTLNSRDRNLVAEQQLDTMIFMQYPPSDPRTDVQKTPGAWEIDVPNGTYTVRVGAGDAGCASEGGCTQQRLNIEGVTALTHQEDPPGAVFAQTARTVAVSDGKLTIDAIGGAHTKLDYADVIVADRAPIAALITPDPPSVGGDRPFSAYALDPDGSVAGYEWDLDGDGTFETDSGTTSTLFAGAIIGGEVQYRNAAKFNVGVRVTDDQGFTREVSRQLRLRANVNFQPWSVQQPDDVPYYPKDVGAAYDPSLAYGWVTEASVQSAPHDSASHQPLNIQPNGRVRQVVTSGHPCATQGVENQLPDTFIYMQYPPQPPRADVQQVPGAWEMAVPDGTYLVTVAVGDPLGAANPQFNNSVHVINVEGQRAIDAFVPTPSAPCSRATVQVTVTDGRLTLDAIGGTNTKLSYVQIRPQ